MNWNNRYAGIFFLFFITYGYFFQGGGWNQNTRICLTRAVIHQQSLSIDAYKEDSKNPDYEFVNTGDWAYYNGHYYTNKSPGISFLAVVPFAVTEYIAGSLGASEEKSVLLATYASSLSIVALSGALLCTLIAFFCIRFFQYSPTMALLAAVAFGFGTMAFSYSTTLYCHLPAACCAFAAFLLAATIRHNPSSGNTKRALAAGFSASLAVLIEPSTIWILVLLVLYLLTFQAGRRCLPPFFIGCIPCGLLQCIYNAACFGGPFSSSYNYSNPVVMWEVDGSLFGWPGWKRFVELLFLPYRGLFVTSPILLMSIPGFFLLLRQKDRFPETLFCSSVTLVFFIFIGCFFAWHGGSAPGPRYLMPAYPFGFLLAAAALKKFPKTFIGLGAVSVAVNLAVTAVTNEIPRHIKNPLIDVVFKNILDGAVSINPVPLSNFENYPSIYKLDDIAAWTPNFNSFNLGEALFPHNTASLIPLFCFWGIWLVVWAKNKAAG